MGDICHFLAAQLQNPSAGVWKTSSEVLVDIRLSCRACNQSYLILWKPLDCSPDRLLCPWDFSGKNTGVLSFPPPGDLPDPGIEPASPAWQANSLPLSHQGSLEIRAHCSPLTTEAENARHLLPSHIYSQGLDMWPGLSQSGAVPWTLTKRPQSQLLR